MRSGVRQPVKLRRPRRERDLHLLPREPLTLRPAELTSFVKLKTYELAWASARRGELLVLLDMARHADKLTAITFVTAPTIAAETGIDERHVRRLQASLLRRGALETVKRGGGRGNSTKYRLTGKPINPDAEATVSQPKKRGATDPASESRNTDISNSKEGHGQQETMIFRAPNNDAGGPHPYYPVVRSIRWSILALQAARIRSISNRQYSVPKEPGYCDPRLEQREAEVFQQARS